MINLLDILIFDLFFFVLKSINLYFNLCSFYFIDIIKHIKGENNE